MLNRDNSNRLVACYRTNQEVVLEKYEGDDPVQFSLSANLHRRHLNPGQRAVVALKVRELLQPAAKERQREAGGDRKSEEAKSVSADLREAIQPKAVQPAPPPTPAEQRKSTAQAAKAVGASPRAVEQAARGDLQPETLCVIAELRMSDADRALAELPADLRADVILTRLVDAAFGTSPGHSTEAAALLVIEHRRRQAAQ